MSELRYVRVYVKQARSGDLPMGCREVFVLDADTVYPTVFYLSNMSVALLFEEDFEAAVDREVTPAMAKTMLSIIKDKAPAHQSPELEDALQRVTAFARHIIAHEDDAPAKRVRTRARVRGGEESETEGRQRTRTRSRNRVREPQTRTRRRSRA
tara:strand:- start:244 stop:705 length:462 start_codon:yes stop_codon:yes gene_type:complete